MLIKSADDRTADVLALEKLLARGDVGQTTANLIRQEIKNIRTGVWNERQAAFQIDFYLKDSPNMMAIHDLRVEHGGRSAQIDHLIINRGCDIWVCESKSFSEGVSINEHGEWCAYGRAGLRGIASPIEQNKRHLLVLQDIFDDGLVGLPKRLGVIPLRPELHSLVLVSDSARIDRPDPSADVDGLEGVIKCDQLITTIDKAIDAKIVRSVMKVIGRGAVENLARNLVALHRPMRTNWEARFGIRSEPGDSFPDRREAVGAKPAVHPVATRQSERCASCTKPVSPKVLDFCRSNAVRLNGKLLCWKCQRRIAATQA